MYAVPRHSDRKTGKTGVTVFHPWSVFARRVATPVVRSGLIQQSFLVPATPMCTASPKSSAKWGGEATPIDDIFLWRIIIWCEKRRRKTATILPTDLETSATQRLAPRGERASRTFSSWQQARRFRTRSTTGAVLVPPENAVALNKVSLARSGLSASCAPVTVHKIRQYTRNLVPVRLDPMQVVDSGLAFPLAKGFGDAAVNPVLSSRRDIDRSARLMRIVVSSRACGSFALKATCSGKFYGRPGTKHSKGPAF